MVGAGDLQEVVSDRLSFLRQRWLLRNPCNEAVQDIKRRFSVSDLVAQVLVSRGIAEGGDDIEHFLSPRLKHYLPHPYILQDMEKAVGRVIRAIESGEGIVLYGDYDVDGGSSVAMLQGYLSALGHAKIRTYIPERSSEGYGVNEGAIDILAAEGHRLIITMDCGTSSHGALGRACELGLDVIVLDHHKPDSDLPQCFALVNPNLLSNGADVCDRFGILAAVGVSFLFLFGLQGALREAGFFAGDEEPDLFQYLDLVALGTVCDVVPLRGLNRAFVFQGLKIMNRKGRLGLRSLCDVSGIDDIDEGDLGFQLGPRLNAGSRMGESGLAHALLSSSDESEATALSWRLNELNIERRALQSEQMVEVLVKVDDYLGASGDSVGDVNHILVSGDNFHHGLVGIFAGRVKERYRLPSIVIGFDGDIGRGSGRSVGGIDLGSAVIAAHRAGLLVSGGGHGMAVGLTIERSRLADFGEFLTGRISEQLGGSVIGNDLVLDIELSLSSVTGGLVRDFGLLGPYGSGHVMPLPLFRGVRVGDVRVLKDRHVSCRLYDSGGSVRGIIFDGVDHVLGGVLLGAGGGDEFDIVGRVQAPWGNSRVGSIVIEDMAKC